MQAELRTDMTTSIRSSGRAAKKDKREVPSSSVVKTLSFLLILSLVSNVVLITGCQSVHDFVYGTPCRYLPSADLQGEGQPKTDSALRKELKKLATLASVSVGEKSDKVLVKDIHDAIAKSKNHEADIIKALQQIDSELGGKDVESKEVDEILAEVQEKSLAIRAKHDSIMSKPSVAIPPIFEGFDDMAKDLSTPQEKAMRTYHDFIKTLQEKRVIVIEPED